MVLGMVVTVGVGDAHPAVGLLDVDQVMFLPPVLVPVEVATPAAGLVDVDQAVGQAQPQ